MGGFVRQTRGQILPMKIVNIICRVLLGLAFFASGLIFFLKLMPEPPPPGGAAGQFIGALAGTGYLAVIKALELLGGALVLSGRFTALGLLVLGPILVNICLYDFFLDRKGLLIGVVIGVLWLVLLAQNWRQFSPIFRRAGGGAK